MKTLLILEGIGIQGKTTICNTIMETSNPEYPIYHLPQVNRDYFRTLKSESQGNLTDLFQLYVDTTLEFLEKSSDNPVDSLYVTERSPLDYLVTLKSIAPESKFDLYSETIKIEEDGNNLEYFMDDAADYIMHEFRRRFDKILVINLMNLDLNWLKEYFNRLKVEDPDNIHRKLYSSRGCFIMAQDRFYKHINEAYENFLNHLDKEDNIRCFSIVRSLIEILEGFFENSSTVIAIYLMNIAKGYLNIDSQTIRLR